MAANDNRENSFMTVDGKIQVKLTEVILIIML